MWNAIKNHVVTAESTEHLQRSEEKENEGEKYSPKALAWIGPGCFRRFKNYAWPCNLKVIGEAAAAAADPPQ